MSLGLIKLKELCAPPELPLPSASATGLIGIPSRTYKGWVPPSMELVPRMEIPIPPPGSALSVTTTPATCPCNKLSKVAALFCSNCSVLSWVIEPERSFLLTSK